MGSLPTWIRYAATKFEHSIKISWESYNAGHLNAKEFHDCVWKNFFHSRLTFLHMNKGKEMEPTIAGHRGNVLVRKLPVTEPKQVFVGDVVLLLDPEKQDDFIIRRLAAKEGYEMVSKDEKDTPFVLEKNQCWITSDNENMKPKSFRLQLRDSEQQGLLQIRGGEFVTPFMPLGGETRRGNIPFRQEGGSQGQSIVWSRPYDQHHRQSYLFIAISCRSWSSAEQ